MLLQKVLASMASLIVLAGAWPSWAQQSPATAPAAARPAQTAQEEERRPEFPTVYVTDLHCQHCARRLARKLFSVPGVTKVQARVKDNVAVVVPQKGKIVSPLALWEATEAAKFEVVRIETPDSTYDKKPVELATTQRKPTGATTPR